MISALPAVVAARSERHLHALNVGSGQLRYPFGYSHRPQNHDSAK